MTRRLTLLLICAASAASAQELDPRTGHQWQRILDDPPYGELQFTAGASLGGKIYLMGGHNQKVGWRNDVWSSPTGEEWTQESTGAPWPARAQHAVMAHDGRLWVVGGTGWELYNDVWSSPDGREWTLATAAAPWAARSDFASTVHDGRLWVMGGLTDGPRTNDVWASADGENWELVTEHAGWRTRSHSAAVTHNGRIYVAGGAFFHQPSYRYFYLNDVWSSVDGKEWELVTMHAEWTPRHMHKMVSLGDSIWLVGGDDKWWTTELLRDTWRSTDGASWENMPRTTRGRRLTGRNTFALVAHDNAIHLMGGLNYFGGTFWSVTEQYRTPPIEDDE